MTRTECCRWRGLVRRGGWGRCIIECIVLTATVICPAFALDVLCSHWPFLQCHLGTCHPQSPPPTPSHPIRLCNSMLEWLLNPIDCYWVTQLNVRVVAEPHWLLLGYATQCWSGCWTLLAAIGLRNWGNWVTVVAEPDHWGWKPLVKARKRAVVVICCHLSLEEPEPEIMIP